MQYPLFSANSCLDCGLDKGSPSVTEELSYEVSFSESITVLPKTQEWTKNQRFRKEDSALPVSLFSIYFLNVCSCCFLFVLVQFCVLFFLPINFLLYMPNTLEAVKVHQPFFAMCSSWRIHMSSLCILPCLPTVYD